MELELKPSLGPLATPPRTLDSEMKETLATTVASLAQALLVNSVAFCPFFTLSPVSPSPDKPKCFQLGVCSSEVSQRRCPDGNSPASRPNP